MLRRVVRLADSKSSSVSCRYLSSRLSTLVAAAPLFPTVAQSSLQQSSFSTFPLSPLSVSRRFQSHAGAASTTTTRHTDDSDAGGKCAEGYYVVSAANFDREVIQSQQAVCLVYTAETNTCRNYIKTAVAAVDKVNRLTSRAIWEGPEADGKKDESAAAATAAAVGSGVKAEEKMASPQPAGEGIAETEVEIEVEEDDKSPADGAAAAAAAATSAASSVKAAEATIIEPPAPSAAKKTAKAAPRRQQYDWIKLCCVNADENRNLASAFSVQRAKLPVTFFIMQGTIIDRVTGATSAERLGSILLKFLDHYQSELNVDLLDRQTERTRRGELSANEQTAPFLVAAPADLVSGASTTYLVRKITESLAGPDRLQLPQETHVLDGIRATLRDTKKKCYEELYALQESLGMHQRKLGESELERRYYSSSVFVAYGLISALECLYLARCYASVGDVDVKNVRWARDNIQTEFAAILGNEQLKRLVALIDVNVVVGTMRDTEIRMNKEMQNLMLTMQSFEGGNDNNTSGELFAAAMQSCEELTRFLEAYKLFTEKIKTFIADKVDSRTVDEKFPVLEVEELFTLFKSDSKQKRELQRTLKQRAREREGGGADAQRRMGDKAERYLDVMQANEEAMLRLLQERISLLTTVLTSTLNYFSKDPQSVSARTRLSSLLY